MKRIKISFLLLALCSLANGATLTSTKNHTIDAEVVRFENGEFTVIKGGKQITVSAEKIKKIDFGESSVSQHGSKKAPPPSSDVVKSHKGWKPRCNLKYLKTSHSLDATVELNMGCRTSFSTNAPILHIEVEYTDGPIDRKSSRYYDFNSSGKWYRHMYNPSKNSYSDSTDPGSHSFMTPKADYKSLSPIKIKGASIGLSGASKKLKIKVVRLTVWSLGQPVCKFEKEPLL